MIHELIDPKKKANKTSATKNIKTLQESKAVFEDCSFEPSDSENKEAESSSTTFIPPWLRNSLGLNQKNNLSHPAASTDIKSVKTIQKCKEPNQNEFYSSKVSTEQDCSKKTTDNFEATPLLDYPQEDNITNGTDNVEDPDLKNNRAVSVYWDLRRKASETDSNCTYEETKSSFREDPKMIDADIITLADLGKIKEEEKKRLKLMKQKNKLRKRNMGDQKLSDLDKTNIDFLLEMKARETLDNLMKKDIHSVKSEMKNLEENVLIINPKNLDSSNPKINHQELRLLQEIKNQVGSVEEVERLFEHVKEFNIREIIKNPVLKTKSITEKKREDKEEKNTREAVPKGNEHGNPTGDKDSLLSTDDENDIKRFSEFLSKNKNLDEKRKCLEEVRNYFERKRRARMTKRRLEEEKSKAGAEPEEKAEHARDKLKFKDFYRERKSKFSLCDEEVVEKAVDETLQKFVEMYHIHVSPTVMGNMKKNILQAMTSDNLDTDSSKPNEISPVKKPNVDLSSNANKDSEKAETRSFPEPENTEISNKELLTHKEIKKKNFKTLIESSGEQFLKLTKEIDVIENEKLKRLRKEFDCFLHSVKSHFDVTNLKLQRIILEKEELTVPSKNVQFVYNFTKKSLESESPEFWPNREEASEMNNLKDSETQTVPATEVMKRNVKVQAFEQKSRCEENLQTDDAVCTPQSTQTNDERISLQEIKKITSGDVHPGLYRMVKSKEAGKFYLYPEQAEEVRQGAFTNASPWAAKSKKTNKKRELHKVVSKDKAKERRVYFKEKEKAKLKKSKKAINTLAPAKSSPSKKEKDKIETGNSINCLYFRDLNKKNSESVSSKKEMDLTDENISGRLEDGEELGVGDAKEEISKENHMGCFWFWNGEKITPGCDLKTHVEDLLKEKLKEIANAEIHQKDFVVNTLSTDRHQQSKVSQRSFDGRNANGSFCASNAQNNASESSKLLELTENERLDERNQVDRKKNEEESRKILTQLLKKTSVKNVATQNSQQAFLSLNLSKLNIQSKMGNSVKRKCNKRNIVIRPAKGKTVNLKKAEEIIRAVEEFRKIRLGFENPKKDNSLDSESTVDGSTFTSGSKNEVDDALSVVFGLKDCPEVEEISNLDFKNRLKNFNNSVDREIQTNEKCDFEDVTFGESQPLGKYKHLELIESVLGRASHKEREDLWHNITDFIKTKIGRDINDEGAREVCIEIEQEMPKYDQGKTKHTVMAKGHYAKNEGDVEVEIDLTLDDLEKILRQRQKKSRRRTLYRSSKSKNFLSSSSIQSDFTKEDLRRYQKYLHRFAVLGGGFVQNKEMKTFLEK